MHDVRLRLQVLGCSPWPMAGQLLVPVVTLYRKPYQILEGCKRLIACLALVDSAASWSPLLRQQLAWVATKLMLDTETCTRRWYAAVYAGECPSCSCSRPT